MSIIFLITIQQYNGQQEGNNKKEIRQIVNKYSESVIERDSIKFYDLFKAGNVTWCAATKDKSQAKKIETKGIKEAGTNYFSGTYKGFFRALFRYQSTEDRFDNIKIIEDGTVASVTMDYSFWANSKMTNWGSKYLTLIKTDGIWRITSVIYSLELTEYFDQPSLKKRKKLKNQR